MFCFCFIRPYNVFLCVTFPLHKRCFHLLFSYFRSISNFISEIRYVKSILNDIAKKIDFYFIFSNVLSLPMLRIKSNVFHHVFCSFFIKMRWLCCTNNRTNVDIHTARRLNVSKMTQYFFHGTVVIFPHVDTFLVLINIDDPVTFLNCRWFLLYLSAQA